jgi:hypothetical protein
VIVHLSPLYALRTLTHLFLESKIFNTQRPAGPFLRDKCLCRSLRTMTHHRRSQARTLPSQLAGSSVPHSRMCCCWLSKYAVCSTVLYCELYCTLLFCTVLYPFSIQYLTFYSILKSKKWSYLPKQLHLIWCMELMTLHNPWPLPWHFLFICSLSGLGLHRLWNRIEQHSTSP